MKYILPLLLLLLQGCIIVPAPAHRENGRIFIAPEMVTFIQPDVTSREEVLLKLGDPDGIRLHDRIFFYKWVASKGVVLTQGGAGSMRFDQFFLVAFNSDNTVRKLEIIKRDIDKRKKPLTQFVIEWYGEAPATDN